MHASWTYILNKMWVKMYDHLFINHWSIQWNQSSIVKSAQIVILITNLSKLRDHQTKIEL